MRVSLVEPTVGREAFMAWIEISINGLKFAPRLHKHDGSRNLVSKLFECLRGTRDEDWPFSPTIGF
jgi:hypothetical protein